MSLIKDFDPKDNFWKVHPDLKYPQAFKALRTKDKTRDKAASSKYMWFIALCYDWNSKYMQLEESDRWETVGIDFFKDPQFIKRVDLTDAIFQYNKLQDTPARRQYRELMNMMDERTKFLSSVKYTSDNYKMIEDIMKNSSNIYSELEAIKQKVEQEESTGKMIGGARTSMMDEMDDNDE